ncbi:hypothetical protein [Mediterraneibacter agrestimuris]|uniref:hypothetical protein n=1 Tax=Mediterraneibacter agrestimuris TaxID=2941333 RepID=UPI00203E59EC|nr:hypothetical protein [Mediterraneibacter agrestimuris]
MENVQEILSEVMKQVYKEYTGMVEIEKLTRELEDALNRSDRKAAELILEMRQKEMDSISQVKQAIGEFLRSMDADLQEDVKCMLQGELPRRQTGPEAEKISSISRQRNNMLKNICARDRILSRRVAGEDSYYNYNE